MWKDYIIPLILYLIFDFIWLGFITKHLFQITIHNIQKSPMNIRWIPIILVYILLSFALSELVIKRADNWQSALKYGAIFGLVVYGIFDLTNYSLFENWTLHISLLDIGWGAFVSSLVAVLSYFVKHHLKWID